MPAPRSLRATVLTLAGLLSVPLTMAAAPAGVAAAPAPCKVVEQGKSGSRSNLQAALKAAGSRATLIVTGTCAGAFTVSRTVTLKQGATAGVIKGSGGRALDVTGGTLTVIGLRLTGSTALDCPGYLDYLCGAVLLNHSTVVLDRVTVSGSLVVADTDQSVYGSALFNLAGATMTIKRSTIRDNGAAAEGVGLEADGVVANEGTMTIRASRITGNQSSADEVYGGTLYAYEPTSRTTIVDSTFADNVADGGSYGEGGAIVAHQGSTTIRRSLFTGNSAGGTVSYAGAVVVYGTLRVEDSTFTGNRAGKGGAIEVSNTSASLVLRGTTIARNTAAQGGGIYQAAGASVEIGSSIIALNTAGPAGSDCSGTFTTAEYNLVGSGDGCDGLTHAVSHDKVGTDGARIDPKLGALAKNGGPTKTLALLKGSPAINAAGPAACDTPKDQRGVKRPQGGTCDIGAFEKQ